MLNKLIGDVPGAVEQFWQEAAQDSGGCVGLCYAAFGKSRSLQSSAASQEDWAQGHPAYKNPEKAVRNSEVYVHDDVLGAHALLCAKTNPRTPFASAQTFALCRFRCCCISTKAKAPKQGRCGSLARSSSLAPACLSDLSAFCSQFSFD